MTFERLTDYAVVDTDDRGLVLHALSDRAQRFARTHLRERSGWLLCQEMPSRIDPARHHEIAAAVRRAGLTI